MLTDGARVASVSLATRSQTDMRGLATARRGVGWNGTARLGLSVAPGSGCSWAFHGSFLALWSSPSSLVQRPITATDPHITETANKRKLRRMVTIPLR